MIIPQFPDNPFQVKLSFHKMIERFEGIAATDNGYAGDYAKGLLRQVSEHPELKDGIENIEVLKENQKIISDLLAELFPAVLSQNEIKAVSLPYLNLIFNFTERFQKIMEEAGTSFDINIRDFNDHQFYIASCCLILNRFYGTNLDFTKPLFYDIPTSEGIIKHYRILYNADFIEIIETEKAPKLTQADIEQLIDNYDDLALWKKTFPVGGWILKGFALMTLVDVTVENAVSILKGNLLEGNAGPDLQKSLIGIFRSIFKVPDMKIGFTSFDQDEGRFTSKPFGQKAKSYLLPDKTEDDCTTLLCPSSYNKLIDRHDYFAVADTEVFSIKNPDSRMAERFKLQGIRSFVLAPVVKNNTLLGVIELVSPNKNDFNTVNAHKLEVVMPYIVDNIDRSINEAENKIRAVIQNNYTTLHPSVDWKFRREAQNYIVNNKAGLAYTLKEIVFRDVFPLYGQVDIKDSSITRNTSVKNDLIGQLNQVIYLLSNVRLYRSVALIDQHLTDLHNFIADLEENLKADTEQAILHYLETWIYPLFQPTDGFDEELVSSINGYFSQIDPISGEFHLNRRSYEKTLTLINEKLATILDDRQEEIQKYFPHYFERFKTDGVEHNLYIGSSIAPKNRFNGNDLRRLRLWQLMVTAEMEIEQFHLKSALPYPLDVTSLILVFSTPISIRFRMDEKHFDVDGAYNVRYEVIKKRIDKACILGTEERITQPGKITVVFSKSEEEAEYTHYINILQKRGILENQIEHFEVEELQGVSGLKGLRVSVLHGQNLHKLHSFSYDKLYN